MSKDATQRNADIVDIQVPEANTEGCESADEGELAMSESDYGIVLEKNDRSLSEFHRWYKSGRLVVDPEWQRKYVWDRKRASKLVESFLVDIPVPVIYLAKNDQGKYEVIDGLQRLTSVFDFFDGEYKLRGLDMLRDLNAKRYADLPETRQNKLQDATLRTFELSPQTPKDLMFVIFERLNTGGVALNDMEIRNCLFRGRLNNLLQELAENEDFISCVNQRGLARRMDDRSLVLRFLSFYERTYHKAKTGLKKFINEFFETYRDPSDEKLQEFRKVFKKAMRASVTVFGDKGFRLRKDVKEGDGWGEWAGRPNKAIFQVVASAFAEYDLGAITRASDAILEEYVDLVCTDERWRDCVRRATGETTRMEYAFSTWHNRLKELLSDFEPNDTERCFSRSLKEELYHQDNTCVLCGQKIALVMDAAMDHDRHYWRGGLTVPDNARLVHRHCNLTREN
ncbi:MAG: GmrSD restriction endonuclease domain-containing protein [Planctomycetota bacterium]